MSLRREPRGEDGVTLIELMVVLMLMSIVSLILFAFLYNVMSTSDRATSESETQKTIALSLRPMTANIRGASSIASIYPSTTTCPSGGSYPTGYTNCLSVTVARPAAGQLTCPRSVYVYGLGTDGKLREDRFDYKLVGSTCTLTTNSTGRVMLTHVINGTQPLFTYFDQLGNQIDPLASGQTSAPFTTAVTVRVTLNVQYKSGAPLLAYTTDLALRNNR